MNYTVDQVVSALSQVTHPGFSNDIVSLNMVKDIHIEGNKISFSLTFQKSTDPLIGSIQKACRVALQTKLGPDIEMGEIIVNSTFKPEIKESTLSKVKNII